MTDDDESSTDEGALLAAIAKLPQDVRHALPTNERGEPQVEVVQALYRHESLGAGRFKWVEVRPLRQAEWKLAQEAISAVYKLTRGLDAFPSLAWGDLRIARDEFLNQMRQRRRPNELMSPLIEYRIINFSTSVKLYYEQVMAQARSSLDQTGTDQIAQIFSETYDRSFAYRLLYAIRNAFQHGDRALITLKGTARLAGPTGQDTEVVGSALLHKSRFASGKSNGAVRREVRNLGQDDQLDLFTLSEQAFVDIENLNERIAPILHPNAPEAAERLARYFEELDGERPHFHEYIGGLPTDGLLSIATLDRLSFAYVVEQTKRNAVYDDGPAESIFAALPSYPQPG